MTRVYHEPGLLVYHQHMVILKEHIERNVFRRQLHLALRIRQHDADHIAGLHLLARLGGLLVHQNIAGLRGDLDAVARCVRQAVEQEFVQPYLRLLRITNDAVMLVKFLLFALRVDLFYGHQRCMSKRSCARGFPSRSTRRTMYMPGFR